jgi:hypothetical protein
VAVDPGRVAEAVDGLGAAGRVDDPTGREAEGEQLVEEGPQEREAERDADDGEGTVKLVDGLG